MRPPPPFMRPSRRRRLFSPVVSIGRSPALMPPLEMDAVIVALASRGMRILSPPFTKSSLTPPSVMRETSMSRPPLTVLASS